MSAASALPSTLLTSLLLLLITLLLPPSVGAAWSAADLTILAVSSPQCRTTASQALDCVLPAQLTITTTAVVSGGVLSSSAPTAANVVVSLPGYLDVSLPLELAATNASGANWTTTLIIPGYVQPALGQLLDLALQSQYNLSQRSQPFQGVSILYTPPPLVTSISGCMASGQALSTLACDVGVSVLTLRGSGFHWLLATGRFRGRLQIGACLLDLWYSDDGTGHELSVVDDATLTYNLANAYESCVYPNTGVYNGSLLAFTVNLPWKAPNTPYNSKQNDVQTAPVFFTFAPIPPPKVKQMVVQTCTEVTVTDPTTPGAERIDYINCTLTGDYDGVYIEGSNLYATLYVGNDTVGWYAGRPPPPEERSPSATSLSAGLPLVPALVPGELYSMKVVNHGGELLLDSRVSYADLTQLVSVDYCSRTSYWRELGCQVGDQITLRGMSFPVNPLAVTVSISSDFDDLPVAANCSNATVVDSRSMVCTLAAVEPIVSADYLYGYFAAIQAQFVVPGADSVVLSNALTVEPLRWWWTEPYFQTAVGCVSQQGPRSLGSCQGGDVIVLQGNRLEQSFRLLATTDTFDPDGLVYNVEQTSVFECYNLTATAPTLNGTTSATQAQCQLPVFDPNDDEGLIALNTLYQLYIIGDRSGDYGVPAFTVQFGVQGDTAQHSSSSISSGVLAAIVIAAVVLAVVVAVAVRCVVVYRRLHKRNGSERSYSRQGMQLADSAGAGGGGGWWTRRGGAATGDALQLSNV